MQKNNLQSTHARLTRLFTVVVFVIIMFLGISFLLTKYLHQGKQEREIFMGDVINFEERITSADFFLDYERKKIFKENKKVDRLGEAMNKKHLSRQLSFFVFHLDKGVVFQDIVETPKFDEIDFSPKTMYEKSDSYIAVRDLKNDLFVVFYREKRFKLSSIGEDILQLLLLACISSLGVYYIGHRFVGRTLRPVEQNLQDMSDFIHNAGHELKTPLAVTRGNLQVMQAEEMLDKKLLKKSIGEIDKTNKLLESLIELSQIGKFSEKSSLALAVEVQRALSDLEDFAKKNKITLHNSVQGKYLVKANPQELQILLMNLLKNAIKYNTKGGNVWLSLHKNTLKIRDDGIGISPKNQKKIFERFYQATDVRSEDGFGIGLSLVKKITDANKWKIQLSSEQEKGSEFRIIF